MLMKFLYMIKQIFLYRNIEYKFFIYAREVATELCLDFAAGHSGVIP